MRSLNPRTFVLTLVALFAAACAASGRQSTPKLDWQEFKSEAGGFSVKFPGVPRVSQESMVRGPLTLTRHRHALTVGGYVFEVSYMGLPAEYDDAEMWLEGGIGLARHTFEAGGGRMLSKDKVVRGACEGLEATFALPQNSAGTGFAQARAFVSGQRYYIVGFISAAGGEGARAAASTFVESFDIRDGCKAPPVTTPAPKAEPVRGTVEGARDAATGWRLIDVPDLGFSMLMPGPAQRESTQTHAQPFAIFRHEFIYEADDIIYTAEVFGDYPAGLYGDDATATYESLLDVTFAGIKRGLGELELTYGEPRKLNVGKYPAREYTLKNERTGLRGRVRMYATPRRSYVFSTLSDERARDAEAERFFSSVRVSPK